MLHEVILFVLGILTGGTAAIVGFGIGSFLTPVLAVNISFGTAVAAVGAAHLCGSILRFWILRREVNYKILLNFGILSAIGGLAGALLQNWASSMALAVVFGGLLVLAGLANLFGWGKKFAGKGSWGGLIGAVSGFFGGLVGNQGGLRAAGLANFKLTKTQFVATATAIALAVDVFRVPVYIITKGAELRQLLPEIAVMSAGVIAGTLLGTPLLRRIPEKYFKIALSAMLIIVGVLVATRI